jgi:molybdopterin synthase sulfur carrier subunit
MNVNILAFGIAKDIFQKSMIEVDLNGAPTVANLKAELEKLSASKQLASI